MRTDPLPIFLPMRYLPPTLCAVSTPCQRLCKSAKRARSRAGRRRPSHGGGAAAARGDERGGVEREGGGGSPEIHGGGCEGRE